MITTNQNMHWQLSGIGIADLAQRIANTDSLMQIVNKLQVENSALKTQLVDCQISANRVQSIFKEENTRANRLQNENDRLSRQIDDAQSEVTRLNGLVISKELYYNQIVENSKMLLEAEKQRSSTRNQRRKNKKKLKHKNSDALCPDQAHSRQFQDMSQQTCPPDQENKISPRFVSRGTQHQTSTITRFTCTSAFIRKHDVSTNFPDVVTSSYQDIFKETIFDFPRLLSPIGDIVDPNCCMETQTEPIVKSSVTVGTCTDLQNVQKDINYIDDSKHNVNISHAELTCLWDLLGQTIFTLIGANGEPMNMDFASKIEYIKQGILSGKRNTNGRFAESIPKRENMSSSNSPHHESYDVGEKDNKSNKSLLMVLDNHHIPKINTKMATCTTYNENVSPNYSAYNVDVNADGNYFAGNDLEEELKLAFIDHETSLVENITAISPMSNCTSIDTEEFDVAENTFLENVGVQHISTNGSDTNSAAQHWHSNLNDGIEKITLKRKSSDSRKERPRAKVRCTKRRRKQLSTCLLPKAISNPNAQNSNTNEERNVKACQYSFTVRKDTSPVCNETFKQEISEKVLPENTEYELPKLTEKHVQGNQYPLNLNADHISTMFLEKPVEETCAENSGKSFTANFPVADESCNTQSSCDEEFYGFELHDPEIQSKNEKSLCFLNFSPSSPDNNEILQSENEIKEIPLERVSEFSLEYSPASPLQENLNTNIVPKEIPLRCNSFQSLRCNTLVGRCIDKYSVNKHRLRVKKANSDTFAERKLLWLFRKIMEKFIISKYNTEDCLKCARRISKRSGRNLTALNNAICEVIEDTDEDISNDFTPPAIVTTHSHRKMTLLIKALNRIDIGFEQQLILFLEQKLFNFKCNTMSFKALINLFLLYLSLVDTRDTEYNSARLILYKCLYFFSKMSHPLAYYILISYPDVLPFEKETNNDDEDKNDPIVKAIQCVLNSQQYDISNVEMKHREIWHILRLYYEYERIKPTREEVVDVLLSKIQLNEFENVNYAFGLICKRNGVEWSTKYVLREKLVPLLEKYTAESLRIPVHDEKIACLLDCISIILKPFPVNYDVGFYRQIFSRMLSMYKCQIVQEAAVLSILRTCRFGYEDCFKLLYSWNPPYKVSNRVWLSVQTFVHRSTLTKLKKMEKFVKDTHKGVKM